MSEDLFEIAASRDYLDSRGDRLRVEIGVPEPDPKGGWRCPARVLTSSKEWSAHGRGVDSLQALALALGHAKVHVQAMQRIRGPLRRRGGSELGFDFTAVVRSPASGNHGSDEGDSQS